MTTQRNELGNYGLTIREDGPAGTARFSVSTPRARSQIAKIIGFGPGDPPHDWKAGDRAVLRARLWFFQADRLQGLFDRFCEARKDFGIRPDQ